MADDIIDWLLQAQKVGQQNKQNLFDADHRNRMIEKYGSTEADFVNIENLQND